MGYVNLPANLQGIFQSIENRVDKLENAQRFTLPNVPVPVTAATGNGTTVTYTARNNFLPGQTVTISGLGIASGASLNLANVTIASATASGFTVTNSTTGVSAGIGQAVALTATVSGVGTGDPAYPRIGDQWLNMANNTVNYVDARGGLGQILGSYALNVLDSNQSLSVSTSVQNLFGSTNSTLTLAPYRTYRIESFVTVLYGQNTASLLTFSQYFNIVGSTGVTSVLNVGVNDDGVIFGGLGVATSSSTSSGGTRFVTVQSTCIVRTGVAAATVTVTGAFSGTNFTNPRTQSGSYVNVTSLGNSTGVLLGPWA